MKTNSKIYKGAIVKESLEDESILNDFKILYTEVTDDIDPAERWTIYNVEVDEATLLKLSKVIKPTKWYAHFWSGREVIAIFRDKIFRFNFDDKKSWESAIAHGLSIGIPQEQLDFLIH
ncbi:MAG: hypothetical protein RLZZ347_837 [Candidatus Parcubacteria bacterium]|jgi:hypothetical protein